MRSWPGIVIAAAFFPALALAQDASSDGASQKKTVGRAHSCEGYFPRDLRYDGAQGETTLAFTVTVRGTVEDLRVAKSSGNAELDAAAIACASHWFYKPATKDNQPHAAPWGAVVVWSVPRADLANQIHRDTKPAAANP
jgi:TonB family protein